MWGAIKINNILIGLIYYILSGELEYHRVFAALDKFNSIDLTPLPEEKTFRVMLIIITDFSYLCYWISTFHKLLSWLVSFPKGKRNQLFPFIDFAPTKFLLESFAILSSLL